MGKANRLGCVPVLVLGIFMLGCVPSVRSTDRSGTAINREHDIAHNSTEFLFYDVVLLWDQF